MKKLIFCLMLAVVGLMATGCSSCQSENSKQGTEKALVQADYDGVAMDFNDGVDHIVALHRQSMFSLIGGKS